MAVDKSGLVKSAASGQFVRSRTEPAKMPVMLTVAVRPVASSTKVRSPEFEPGADVSEAVIAADPSTRKP